MKIRIELTEVEYKEMLESYAQNKLGCVSLNLEQTTYMPSYRGYTFDIPDREPGKPLAEALEEMAIDLDDHSYDEQASDAVGGTIGPDVTCSEIRMGGLR